MSKYILNHNSSLCNSIYPSHWTYFLGGILKSPENRERERRNIIYCGYFVGSAADQCMHFAWTNCYWWGLVYIYYKLILKISCTPILIWLGLSLRNYLWESLGEHMFVQRPENLANRYRPPVQRAWLKVTKYIYW